MPPYTSLKANWFQVLLALADRDLHGSAIMEQVFEQTDGALKLWPGTLYGTLRQMAEAGLIREIDPPEGAPSDRGKRRFYSIRPKGREALAEEVARLEGLLQLARSKRVGGAGG